ncbi:MAG: ATP-binding protein [Bacteroidales bacterium]|nr:ATP-binding protein [Bacteroidales bacterium]
MGEFINYLSSFNPGAHRGLAEIVQEADHFLIYEDGRPMLTPGGNRYSHRSERVVRLLLAEMILSEEKCATTITAPLLFAFQRDILETRGDPFPDQWEQLIRDDPFVRLKTTGKTGISPFSTDDPLFNFSFITVTALVRNINEMVNALIREQDLQESDLHPFTELLRHQYLSLDHVDRCILQAFSEKHQSGLVLPMGLTHGLLSPLEYVHGLISLKMQPETRVNEIICDVIHGLDYLTCVKSGIQRLSRLDDLIATGESDILEFKSTLRWDIRAGKTSQAIERACLKTISAFLNTNGGTLLIGVRDDGTIEGIESDKFVNEDKFLLHLWTLIRTCLGRDVSLSVRTSLEKVSDKTICRVTCIRNSRPVFLRQPGFPEEFYIRVGPSSNAMDISEALRYIADHFNAAGEGSAG